MNYHYRTLPVLAFSIALTTIVGSAVHVRDHKRLQALPSTSRDPAAVQVDRESRAYAVREIPVAVAGTDFVYHGGGMTSSGEFVTAVETSGGTKAIDVRGGTVRTLPTPPGYGSAIALSINDSGVVAGYGFAGSNADAVNPSLATVWQNGRPRVLGTLPGFTASVANAINASGQVAGIALAPRPGLPYYAVPAHAFLWTGSRMRDLGVPAGCAVSRAYAMNNADEIVGWALTSQQRTRAYAWQNGVWHDLGTLPGGHVSAATGINNRGQICGDSDDAQGHLHAILWEGGRMRDLGTSPWGDLFKPMAINDRGDVLIDTYIGPRGQWPPRLYVWNRHDGLKWCLIPDGTTWQFHRAIALGKSGQIVVGGNDTKNPPGKFQPEIYDHRLFVLTPTPLHAVTGTVDPASEKAFRHSLLRNPVLPDTWLCFDASGSDAYYDKEGDAIVVHVLHQGTQDWHINFNEPGLAGIANGQRYVVSFRARADQPHKARVAVAADNKGWTPRGLDATFDLSTTWRTYTFPFTASHVDAVLTRLSFFLGLAPGRVWLTNVTFVPVSGH